VDFDPVHAKAGCESDEDLEAAAKELGISKEILELFPSEFVESEMGMIPLGWEVSTIEDEFSVTMGQSPSGKSYNETQDGMLFFQGRRDFGTYFPSERVYTTEPKRLAKKDDILLSVRAPVGDINIAMNECCIGRGLSALKHKSDAISYSYLVVKNLRVYFDGFNTEGTVFGSVNQNTLKSLNVLKDEKIIKKFIDIAEPMFAEIRSNSIEILSLQKIRDTLLPKLLSCELDVSKINTEQKEDN
jgi:type I restriction enzyme S subunit